MHQCFVVDTFRRPAKKRIHFPTTVTGLVEHTDRANISSAPRSTHRLEAVAAVVFSADSVQEVLYPQWFGAQAKVEDDLVDETQRFAGDKFIWEPYNTTSDNKALDACLLASRPGQTIRFVGRHSLVSSFVPPGRTLEGFTGLITRPPRRLLSPLAPATATDRQIVKTLNLLKAAYQRHLRAQIVDPDGGDRIAAHKSVPVGAETNDVQHFFPMALGEDLGSARNLANELIRQFLRHESNSSQHNAVPTNPSPLTEFNNGRSELIGATNALIAAFTRHFRDHSAHDAALESYFLRQSPDLAQWPTPLGFTPQNDDPVLHTRFFVGDNPHFLTPPRQPDPVVFRGLYFEVDPASQGRFEGFDLEHSAWIMAGADSASQVRLRIQIEDCVFDGSPADGIFVHKTVNATVRRCRALNCFRAGLALTGGNTSLTLSEFFTRGTPELRSGIDMEVEQYGPQLPRFLLEPGDIERFREPLRVDVRDVEYVEYEIPEEFKDIDGRFEPRQLEPSEPAGPRAAVDSTIDFRLSNVYLSHNLQLTLAGLDTLSRPSSIEAEGLVSDGAPYIIEGTHTRLSFTGCVLTNHELLSESSISAGGSRLGTLFFRVDAPPQPIVFEDCVLTTHPAGFVKGQGIPPSQIDANTKIQQIHDYAAFAIQLGPARDLDITLKHCVLTAQDVEGMSAKATRDPHAGTTFPRSLFFNRGDDIKAMFDAAGLVPLPFFLWGLLIDNPNKLIANGNRHRIKVEGCVIGPGFQAAVATHGGAAVEIVRTRIQATVGFLWGQGPHDVRIEQGHFINSRFALFDLTPTADNAGAFRLALDDVEMVADDACWSWWTSASATSQRPLNFSGHRVLTASLDPSPCVHERNIQRKMQRLIPGGVAPDRRSGVRLGMPGDQLRIVDPQPGQPLIWHNAQPGAPWIPTQNPDWRLLWRVK